MEFCRDCQDLDKEVVATRKLASGRHICDEHWRSRLGIPPIRANGPVMPAPPPTALAQPQAATTAEPEKKREAPKMGRRGLDAATVAEIRKDAAAGMGIGKIAEKHEVSWATARNYAKGAAPKNPAPANPKTAATPTGKRFSGMVNALVEARAELARLDGERERLADLIKALERFVEG